MFIFFQNLSTAVAKTVRRPRLLTSVAVSIAVFFALASFMPSAKAMLIAFNAGSSLFIGLILRLMSHATTATQRHRASRQEEGKWRVLLTSLCVVGVVIGALSVELHAAKEKSFWDIGLATSSILLSWLFVVFIFSQHYAHNCYNQEGQLSFPGTPDPDYWDFLYFAATLSMCCQTSDVTVNSSPMRRLVLLHSIVSFFFNIIIIGITVNVVAGVL